MFLNKIISSRTLNLSSLIIVRSFKSEYSLDQIYPESSLNLSKPKEIKSIAGKFSGFIPLDKLQITYSKSTGPGGQNVNKVNTKVEVRFHVATASWIPDLARENLLKLHHNQITKDGFMILRSDKTRLQTLNLADCMDKLRCYIREAEKPPPEILPETLALQKKRQEKAAAQRLREKRHSQSIRRLKNEGIDNVQM
ncbi:peptidyl-tRNA hydrolase ICT1, mitochondrial-like [Argiope bruennichi]|uniref:Large ribosomal subunit protein mL62 n=1 Tax=Argiope bruennichi TaxID=94029 RepID=A0A8T0FBP6_ARGBR|nr:peptidyl-tRNA hydrolase ICT1, mitochondrial-like [Argiope bruennichi]KAF8788331.1 Peptidyl-tRNA hydrolase ICT1 like protein [Argiope bruennichi]